MSVRRARDGKGCASTSESGRDSPPHCTIDGLSSRSFVRGWHLSRRDADSALSTNHCLYLRKWNGLVGTRLEVETIQAAIAVGPAPADGPRKSRTNRPPTTTPAASSGGASD